MQVPDPAGLCSYSRMVFFFLRPMHNLLWQADLHFKTITMTDHLKLDWRRKKMRWRNQLGGYYSSLSEKLSLNWGDSIEDVAGDATPAKRHNSKLCVQISPFHPRPWSAAQTCSVTWMCPSATDFSASPSASA